MLQAAWRGPLLRTRMVLAVKILVLTNFYPPHDFGGYEMSCRDVVERWLAAGH